MIARCNTMLFVYGTLRQSGSSPMAIFLHRHATWRGAAHAEGRLYALDGYPGFVPDRGGHWVAGDLFAIPDNDADAVFSALDDYEECSDAYPQPHEYKRLRLDVRLDGATVTAWTYVYAWPAAGLPLIDSGDFLRERF